MKDHFSDFFRRLIYKVREVRAKTHTYKYESNITIQLGVREHCSDFFRRQIQKVCVVHRNQYMFNFFWKSLKKILIFIKSM